MSDSQTNWNELPFDQMAAFRDRVIATVKEIYPHYIVRPVEPHIAEGFFVGNKQDNVRMTVPLRDLYIRFNLTERSDEDLKETIFSEYAGMLNLADDVAEIEEQYEPTWNDVLKYARPQHRRMSELVGPHIVMPFGQDVCTTLIIDRPQDQIVYTINQEMLDRWVESFEEVFKIAMDNLSNMADGLEIVGTVTPHQKLWNESGVEWASVCLLLPHMRYTLAETIGSPFRFAIPSRHRFYAWVDLQNEEHQAAMKAQIEQEIEKWPNALTTTIYEVDTQGNISIPNPQPQPATSEPPT